MDCFTGLVYVFIYQCESFMFHHFHFTFNELHVRFGNDGVRWQGFQLGMHLLQFFLAEACQELGVHQVAVEHIVHRLFFGKTLLTQAVLQIVGRKDQGPHDTVLTVSHRQKIHTLLADVLHPPTELGTQGGIVYHVGRYQHILARCMVQAAETEIVHPIRVLQGIEEKFSIIQYMGCIEHLTVKPPGAFRYGLGTDFHQCA